MRNKFTLAEKIRSLREAKGVTLHAAAKESGLWKRTLQRLEEGVAIPERTPIATVLLLMIYYWPYLELSDFTENPELQIFTAAKRKRRKK